MPGLTLIEEPALGSPPARAVLGLFDQPVDGFVYPFGTFDDGVKKAVREAGHVYARSTRDAKAGVETFDAMGTAPSCHFIAPDRLPACAPAFAVARRPGGPLGFQRGSG